MRAITDWSQVPLVFDIAYAAMLFNTNRNNIKYDALHGNIPAFKRGKNWMFCKDDIQAWMRGKNVNTNGEMNHVE